MGPNALLDRQILVLGGEFRVSISTIRWVMTGYLLALASAIPITSWASERFGAKRVWLFALALFTTGSVLAGAAWSIEALIAFRVLQGVGAGLILPVGQAMLARAAGPGRIGRVMSVVVGIPLLLAPILGRGALLDLSLFVRRGFAAAAATNLLIGIALFGALILLPLYFQLVRGESPLATGLLLVPQGLGAALAMPLARSRPACPASTAASARSRASRPTSAPGRAGGRVRHELLGRLRAGRGGARPGAPAPAAGSSRDAGMSADGVTVPRRPGLRRKALLTMHIAPAVGLLGTSAGLLIAAVRPRRSTIARRRTRSTS